MSLCLKPTEKLADTVFLVTVARRLPTIQGNYKFRINLESRQMQDAHVSYFLKYNLTECHN